MTLQEIIKRVKEIRDCKGDYEVAHSLEDKLYHDYVALCCHPHAHFVTPVMAIEMAIEIIKTEDIKFNRYCA